VSTTVCTPHPGQTRDCLDPWGMAYVKADGAVSLCCWSRPIGNVKEGTIDALLHNEASREMRRGLLTGAMPHDCVVCPARALVPVDDFRRKVEEFVAYDGRQEMLALRARLHGVQETLVQERRTHQEVDKEFARLRTIAKGFEEQLRAQALLAAELAERVEHLELERGHLRAHVELLVEDAHALSEGRAPILRIVYRWMRGRARSLLGRNRMATPRA
jgi:hypothetical protein